MFTKVYKIVHYTNYNEKNRVFATNFAFLNRIFGFQCRRPLIFQTINSARAYNLSLKYLRFTPSGSIDIGIGKFVFVAKTQFLSL